MKAFNKLISYFLYTLLVYFSVSNSLYSQQALDKYFDHLYENQKMMGSVSMIFNDSIIYQKAIGLADVENNIFNNIETNYRVGSITKTYTATLIIIAVEENKLNLNDKLNKFFPQINNSNKITIENLLQHKSGIFNYTELVDYTTWEQNFHSEDEIISLIASLKSNFEPDSQFQYSNSNYILLGYILEKLYGKTYSEILNEKICKPLKLNRTYYTYKTDVSMNEALSYNIQNTYIQNTNVNYINHIGDGGIVSTANEVNFFLNALFKGKLISKNSLELMLPKDRKAYGYGIIKLPFDKPVGYEHSGRVANFNSQYWYFPSINLGIVSLANAININQDDIQNTILKKAYNLEFNIPNFDQINGLTKEEFNAIKGTYAESLDNDLITISSDGEYLVLQSEVTGQDYIFLEMKDKYIFNYGDLITLTFNVEKKEFELSQNGFKKIYRLLPRNKS